MIQNMQEYAAITKRDDREYLLARGWKPLQGGSYAQTTWKDPYNAASLHPMRDAVAVQRDRDYWILCESVEKAWRDRDQWAAYGQQMQPNNQELEALRAQVTELARERDSLQSKIDMQEKFNAEPREQLRNEIGADLVPGRSLYATAYEVIRRLRIELRAKGGQPTEIIRRLQRPSQMPQYPAGK